MVKNNPYNETQVEELKLYIDNDGDIYKNNSVPVYTNLEKKKNKGTYEEDKAEVSFKRIADVGATKYGKEFGNDDGKQIFSVDDRKEVAKRLRKDFEVETEAQGGKMFN